MDHISSGISDSISGDKCGESVGTFYVVAIDRTLQWIRSNGGKPKCRDDPVTNGHYFQGGDDELVVGNDGSVEELPRRWSSSVFSAVCDDPAAVTVSTESYNKMKK